MLTHRELLETIAEEKKHTFISTGMSTLDQIAAAIKIFKNANCSFELMHTNSTYPMPVEGANLRVIETLRDKFDCDVGYRGHEVGIIVTCTAVALGASSVERHITLDRSMYGSDQAASLEPKGMKNLSESINKMSIALGEEKLGNILEEEKPISKKLRAHIKN